MHRFFLGVMLAVAAACAAAEPAAVPPPGVKLVHIVSLPARGVDLIGMPVHHAGGTRAGRIVDLVLDIERNRVRHAVVANAGGRIAVSLFHLHLALARSHLVLPENEALVQQIDASHGPRLSALLDLPVHDADGAPLGTFAGLLVDLHEGDVPFALLRIEDTLHPVPLDALRLKQDALMLALPADALAPAYSFSAAQLRANLEDNRFLRRHARYADRLTPGMRGL